MDRYVHSASSISEAKSLARDVEDCLERSSHPIPQNLKCYSTSLPEVHAQPKFWVIMEQVLGLQRRSHKTASKRHHHRWQGGPVSKNCVAAFEVVEVSL